VHAWSVKQSSSVSRHASMLLRQGGRGPTWVTGSECKGRFCACVLCSGGCEQRGFMGGRDGHASSFPFLGTGCRRSYLATAWAGGGLPVIPQPIDEASLRQSETTWSDPTRPLFRRVVRPVVGCKRFVKRPQSRHGSFPCVTVHPFTARWCAP
jgi:hypothetical protein